MWDWPFLFIRIVIASSQRVFLLIRLVDLLLYGFLVAPKLDLRQTVQRIRYMTSINTGADAEQSRSR